jgi:prepilin peptidase CpaA
VSLSFLTLAAFALFPICMAYAAASDLLTMTISNWIPAVLVAGFMACAPLIGLDLSAIALHWAVGFVVLLIGFGCFAMGWMGGGDAKLAAAAALWFGPAHAIDFVGLSAVLGGGLTFLMLSYRRTLMPGVVMRVPWLARLHRPDVGVPYGIARAAAALIIYPATAWMTLAQ